MIDLSGKAFVVTGGNGGIGLSLAKGIVACGGSISIWGRSEGKNHEAVRTLEALGGTASAFVCDVSDQQQVNATMSDTIAHHGRIDGLFANAGVGGTGTPFLDLSLDEWREVMAVNLDGVFITLQAAARQLVKQGEGGSLVAVSSTSAIHGAAGNEAYGTAKTALNGLVRALAVGLARYRIRVNSLLPGWTITDIAAGNYENDTFRSATIRRTPVRRWADPDEFCTIGAFLADPLQTFHTGQEVCVDGGYTVF